MKRKLSIVVVLLALLVSTIAYATKDPVCPNCSYIQTWSGTLAQNGSVTHAANVTGGVWYRAETGGSLHPLTSGQQQQWLAVLADTGPWAEPTFANPTCTDAGATYLIVSLPNRPFLLRAANCATPKSERLGLAAINL